MSAEPEEPLVGPVPLERRHKAGGFSCGKPELDEYLRRYALTNQRKGCGRTYVALRGQRIAAYYTLAAGSVSPEDAPEPVSRGLGRYPIPVVLLARLAVDENERGRGLGAAMLKDALRRALGAAQIVGARAVLTHAKDEDARRFYERFDFVSSPRNALHLFLLLETIRWLGDDTASKRPLSDALLRDRRLE